MTSCTELLEALDAAIVADKEWRDAERLSKVRTGIAVDHFAACVKALEDTTRRLGAAAEHFGMTEPHYAGAMRAWATEAQEPLADLRRALEAALEVK